jgi:hypothetical protein
MWSKDLPEAIRGRCDRAPALAVAVATALAATLLLLGPVAAPAAAAPGWLAPTTVASAGTGGGPVVASGPDGEAIAAWTSGGGALVQASIHTAGAGWSTPVDLDPGQRGQAPKIAIGQQGEAVVAWESIGTGNEHGVDAATLSPGTDTWSAPTELMPISGSGPQTETAPEVAIGGDGEALVGWVAGPFGDESLETSTLTPGGSWSAPTAVTTAAEEIFFGVAVGPRGEAVAAWESTGGSGFALHSASRAPGASWSVPTEVMPTEVAVAPRVAIGPEGKTVAVWVAFIGGQEEVVAGTFVDGTWSTPTTIGPTGIETSNPQVAIGPGGSTVAVWELLGGSGRITEAAALNSNGVWSAPVELSEAGMVGEQPNVAIGPNGEALATWWFYAPGEQNHSVVQASVLDPGGSWSAPVDLTSSGETRGPKLAAGPHGDPLAIWTTGEGGEQIVHTATYDVSPPVLGSLTIPAEATTGQSSSFSVAAVDAWSTIGATTWNFGDGTTAEGAEVTHAYSRPGTYEVTVTVEDAAGNASSASGTVIDRSEPINPPPVSPPTEPGSTPTTSPAPSPAPSPNLRITHRPAVRHKGPGDGMPRYTFRFFDPAPGATYRCSLDGGPFKPCTSPTVYRRLKPGRHVFRVKSLVDGNASVVHKVSFRAAGKVDRPGS